MTDDIITVSSTGPNRFSPQVQQQPQSEDVVIDQRAQINVLKQVAKEFGREGNINVFMIGQMNMPKSSNGNKEEPSMQGLRNVTSGPDIPSEARRRAFALFKKFPKLGMDGWLKLCFEYAWGESTSPGVVAEIAGCNTYQAKWFGKKFGLIE